MYYLDYLGGFRLAIQKNLTNAFELRYDRCHTLKWLPANMFKRGVMEI
jgi:hypothetical protein